MNYVAMPQILKGRMNDESNIENEKGNGKCIGNQYGTELYGSIHSIR
jgi:hypothetical protein